MQNVELVLSFRKVYSFCLKTRDSLPVILPVNGFIS